MTETHAPLNNDQRLERLQRLGLVPGQRRIRGLFVRQAFWYDEHGHLLGSGDLSAEDIDRISRSLLPRERFVVVLPIVMGDLQRNHRGVNIQRISHELLAESAYLLVRSGYEDDLGHTTIGKVYLVDHEQADRSLALQALAPKHITTAAAYKMLG